MKLRSSPPSPFGRKVKIAALLCGIHLDIEWADTSDPSDTLRTQNPLGKIPVLLRDNGIAVYDSRVILEFLDGEAGGGALLPIGREERLQVLTTQALADGLADAALLQVYETRLRTEETRSARWLETQAGKVSRALAAFEAALPAHGPVSCAADAGEIALACALGYLDLRFAGTWRADHPSLVEWLDGFAARVPAFATTRPPL